MSHVISGIDVLTATPVRVELARTILDVAPAPDDERTYLAPGWIDLQVNGFAGVDYSSPHTTQADLARSIAALVSTGVTRACPTVITGAPDNMRAALANLALAKETLPLGEVFEGFHVEGPHISPDDGPRGAHPRHWVRPPDIEEFLRWQDAARGHIRLVTVAPEWPDAPRYINALVSMGVTLAIGHTAATREQIAAAVDAGATLSTHLGNGAHAVLPRHPNYLWDQLADDRLSASLIVDGFHLPASFLRVAVRAKQASRVVLVTDASAPACASPGVYRLGDQSITHAADGRVVLTDTNRMAGSALRMDRAISNVCRLAGVSLPEAIPMATVNAARVGRIAGRQAGLVSGDRADVVRFELDASGEIGVLETYVSGTRAFARA